MIAIDRRPECVLDPQVLERPLPVSGVRAESLARDARVFQVAQMVERGAYVDAAVLAGELLQEGCRAIRVLSTYMLGLFVEYGIGVLPVLLSRVEVLLTSELEGSEAGGRHARAGDSSVSWLVRMINEQIAFHAAKKDETLAAWIAALDSQDITALCERGAAVRVAAEEALGEEPTCIEQVSRLERTLREELAPAVRKRERAQARRTDEAAAAQGPEEAAAIRSDVHSAPAPVAEAAASGGSAPGHGYESHALQELKRKLQAFELLMERQDVVKAAVVANDIRDIIANFDPILYLPKLFTSYSRLLSESIDVLLPHWEDRENPMWRALELFYRTDLEAFLGTSASS